MGEGRIGDRDSHEYKGLHDDHVCADVSVVSRAVVAILSNRAVTISCGANCSVNKEQ